MKKFRVAMIGVGQISQSHHKMLSKIPDRCEVIGMHDINPKQAEKRHKEWGYRIYSSRAELLADKPDACWVMTPVGPRIEIFKDCFAAGCHVFTEKPLALNNEDARTCVDLAKKANRLLGFGCNERHEPASHTMAQIFFSGALGRLVKVYAQTYIHRLNEHWAKKLNQPDAWRLTFEASGGRIFEFSIHLVNWVQWIGGEPVYVCGANDAVSEALAKNGLDDVVSALIKFDQGYGVVETIMAPGNRKDHRRDMGIIGAKGECWFDAEEHKVHVVVPEEKRNESFAPNKCASKAEDFFDAIEQGRQPLNDGAAALATTRICYAFNQAVREKRTVLLK